QGSGRHHNLAHPHILLRRDAGPYQCEPRTFEVAVEPVDVAFAGQPIEMLGRATEADPMTPHDSRLRSPFLHGAILAASRPFSKADLSHRPGPPVAGTRPATSMRSAPRLCPALDFPRGRTA